MASIVNFNDTPSEVFKSPPANIRLSSLDATIKVNAPHFIMDEENINHVIREIAQMNDHPSIEVEVRLSNVK